MTENTNTDTLITEIPVLPFSKGKSRKERMMYPALAVLSGLLAFLFCAKPLPLTDIALGVPLSDAFLCAGGAFTPFIFLGNIIGTVFYGHASIERFLTLALVFVIRMISDRKHGELLFFGSSVLSKTAFASVMALVQCMLHIAKSGFTLGSVKSVLATLTVLPALTVILALYFFKPTKSRAERYIYEVCALIFFSCAVYVCNDIRYAFCSLGALLTVFLTLCVAKHGGTARGCICGAVLGYIASPAYLLPYILLGASSSILFTLGTFSACSIACALTCISAILVSGTSSLISFIPETVISCAITTPILRYSFIPKGFPFPQTDTEAVSSEKNRALPAVLSVSADIKNTARCFYELSGAIKRQNGSCSEESEITEKICRELCCDCPLSPICLDTAEKETKRAVAELIGAICRTENNGYTPEYLLEHCIKLKQMQQLCKEAVPASNTSPAPLSVSYASVCDMLSLMAHGIEDELVFDPDEERKVRNALFSSGIVFSRICVIGSERKKLLIYGADRNKLKHALPEIRKKLPNSCFDLTKPYYGEEPDSPAIFKMGTRLKADAAIACSSKEGESVNGDTAVSFCDNDGHFYALIADGMGSGQCANESSTAASELIRHFMLCNMDNELAIKLTNEALTGVCNECFSTLDLLRIDTKNGRACVTKSHASPSFIVRGGSVYRCRGTGMPLGIVDEALPSKSEFSVTAGDAVIMVSDGITDGEDNVTYLTDIIGTAIELDAKKLADKLLSKSIELKGRCDDMTVLVIKISAA